MSDDSKIMSDLSDALSAMILGEKSNPVTIADNYPDNELKKLTIITNELIERINALSDSAFSISNGDLSCEIPKGRMKIHDALKNLQANLSHLSWKTKRIASGDFNQKIDFMGGFSEAFNSMTAQLKEAFGTIDSQKNDLLRKEKEMNRDLKLAALIQKSLISDSISIEGAAIHSIYKPMILVGGDIYSFVEFKNEKQFGVFIADVNGHGVNAALVTGIIKVLINSSGEIRNDPAELLLYINRAFVNLDLYIYFTAFYGICDLSKKEFRYARGGHNLPYLISQNEGISQLDSEGPMLGVMDEIILLNHSINIKSGDKLILYTDGLTETENPNGEPFEDLALPEILRTNSSSCIKDYIDIIYKELIDFSGSDQFDDDVCIIGIEIL